MLLLAVRRPGGRRRSPPGRCRCSASESEEPPSDAAESTRGRAEPVAAERSADVRRRRRGRAGRPVGRPVRRLALTERELQVLRGMADGKSNAEIGRELFVSEDTVKTHARRLFRKLGARDRAHAVAAALPRRAGASESPGRSSYRAAGLSRVVLVVLEQGVVHAVGVAAGVLPAHVVVRVGVEGGLVHPRPAGVEQVAQVGPQQGPVEVVRLAAVLAVDDEPADADRPSSAW